MRQQSQADRSGDSQLYERTQRLSSVRHRCDGCHRHRPWWHQFLRRADALHRGREFVWWSRRRFRGGRLQSVNISWQHRVSQQLEHFHLDTFEIHELPNPGLSNDNHNSSSQKYTTCDYGLLFLTDFDYYSTQVNSICFANKNGPATVGQGRCSESERPVVTGLGWQVLNPAMGPKNASGQFVTHISSDGTSNFYAGWYPRTREKHVTDGLSKTAILAEKHIYSTHLGKGGCYQGATRSECPGSSGLDDTPTTHHPQAGSGALVLVANVGGIARGPEEDSKQTTIGSWHPGACHFLMADGAVLAVSPDISDLTLRQLADRRDGQVAILP